MADTESRIPAWGVLPLSALAWWVGGFLPWLLQELYRLEGFDPLPVAPGPAVAGVASMGLLGGVLAGVCARRAESRLWGSVAAAVGTAVTFAGVAWWQSATAGAERDALLLAGTATAVGLTLGLLVATGPVWLRGAALALPVVLLDGWVWGLVPDAAVEPHGLWWVLAIGLGAALGLTAGTRPLQILGWIPAAVAVWVAQAYVAALQDAPFLLTEPGSVLDVLGGLVRNLGTDGAEHQLLGWVTGLLLAGAIAALRLSRGAAPETGEAEGYPALRAEGVSL